MKKDLVLLFNIDSRFKGPFLVTLASILNSLEAELSVTAYVAHPAADDLKIHELVQGHALFKDQLHRLKISTLPILLENLESRLHTDSRMHAAAYLRVFAMNHLPETVERVIYMDSDMLVLRSLSPLMEIGFPEPLAAVPDYMSRHALSRPGFGAISRTFGYELPHSYFNSGLMVIDRQRWVAGRYPEKAAELLRNFKFPVYDQDALNIVCGGKFHELCLEWNWPYHLAPDLMAWRLCSGALGNSQIRVVHFVEGRKPWDSDYSGPFAPAYRQYLECISGTQLPKSKTTDPILRLLKARKHTDLSLCQRYWTYVNRLHQRLWLALEEAANANWFKAAFLLTVIFLVRLSGGKELPPMKSWFYEKQSQGGTP